MPTHHPNIIRSPLKAIALAGMLALSLCPATTALADGIANVGPAGQPGVVDIVTHTPSWVWPLILFGLFIGWTRTRDRIVTPARLFVMPLLIGGLALHNLASSGASAGGLLGFACGAVAGALAGTAVARRRPARLLDDGRLAVRGDWVPLALVTAIIVMRYARGVAIGLHPALAQDATFMLVDTTLSGFIAAMMVARTIGILPAGFLGGQRQYG